MHAAWQSLTLGCTVLKCPLLLRRHGLHVSDLPMWDMSRSYVQLAEHGTAEVGSLTCPTACDTVQTHVNDALQAALKEKLEMRIRQLDAANKELAQTASYLQQVPPALCTQHPLTLVHAPSACSCLCVRTVISSCVHGCELCCCLLACRSACEWQTCKPSRSHCSSSWCPHM